MAIIQHGFPRATEDLDLLLDDSLDNQSRVKRALEILPEKAILELGEDDIRAYVVVRVCDEFVVDLMTAACGLRYAEVSDQIATIEVRGVPIPFATPELLWRTKQTVREKDIPDRLFLKELIERRSRAE
jgi:hypothetical protein